jgi:hypothetical protein
LLISFLSFLVLFSLAASRPHFGFQDLADGPTAALPGPDPDALGQIYYENLAVPNITGSGTFDNGRNRRINKVFVDSNLQSNLPQKIDGMDDASVGFGIALLLAGPHGIRDGHLVDLRVEKSLFDIGKFVGLYHGNDELHFVLSSVFGLPAAGQPNDAARSSLCKINYAVKI